MSIQPSSTTTDADAIHLLQIMQASLPEPQSSALDYALRVGENPNLDQTFCNTAGKVLHITMKFSDKIEQPVALRGNGPGLSWDADKCDDNANTTSPDFYERTFTLAVPVSEMNKDIEFKVVIAPADANSAIRWQTGANSIVPMSQKGHIAIVEVSNVSFA